MARARPFRPVQFAASVADVGDRWEQVVEPRRLPNDRSQFVRYARSAARIAEWLRSGELELGELGFPAWGDGFLALVEVSDVSEGLGAPVGASAASGNLVNHFTRLLEATNCQLVPQAIEVSGDSAWLADPSLLEGRTLTAVGDMTCIVATRAFAAGRVGVARSQLLAALVPEGRARDFRAEPLEHAAAAPTHSVGPLVTTATRPVFWSLREFRP